MLRLGSMALCRTLAWCLAFALINLAGALSPISVKGTKLYDDEGNQFYVKGVAYSFFTVADALQNTRQCQIDAGLIKEMGANTVRVYRVDGNANHDGCMQAFASQGIYVWVDLPSPMMSIRRNDPEWTIEMFTNWTATIDAFSGYNNTLAFTVSNEVMNDNSTTASAPYVKAAVRDIKAFREARGYRQIPLTYTAGDPGSIRKATAEYLACGEDDDKARVEMFGMNVYTWCGKSNYYQAEFDDLYEDFEALDIPLVFAETGCNEDERDFSDVAAMLGSVFQAVFSGSVVYEWSHEENDYGLVEYEDPDEPSGFPSTLDDYNALSTVFASVNPAGTPRAEYTPSNTPPACPTSDSQTWRVDPRGPLPTIAELNFDTVTARTTIASQTEAGGSVDVTSQFGGQSTGSSSGSDLEKVSYGLSVGSIVGIVVAVVGALVFAALAAFVMMRKRRRAQAQQDMQQQQLQQGQAGGYYYNGGSGSDEAPKPELPADSVGYVVPRQELPADQQHHYGHQSQTYGWNQQAEPSEMDGMPISQPPRELPADQQQQQQQR